MNDSNGLIGKTKWLIRQSFGENLGHYYMDMKFLKQNCTYLTKFRLNNNYSGGRLCSLLIQNSSIQEWRIG